MQKIKRKRMIKRGRVLTGLFTMLAPLAINLGLIGQTVIAQSTELVQDQRLVVTSQAKQKKQETTWTFDFKRTDATAQWISADFDFVAAGLTDVQVTLDQEKLALNDNQVDFEANQEKHTLIVTAKSTTNETRKIELPITFGLYADQMKTTNLLAENNQSVIASLEFKTVQSTTQTQMTQSDSAVPLVGPAPEEAGTGYLTSDPRTAFASLPTVDSNKIEAVLIDKKTSTTPNAANGKTNPNNFQAWAKKTNNSLKLTNSPDGIGGGDAPYGYSGSSEEIVVAQKFDATIGKIDGGTAGIVPGQATSGGSVTFSEVKRKYHNQYENNETAQKGNKSSYFVSFKNTTAMSGFEMSVVYDKVGNYVDSTGQAHAIGAVMHISNVKPAAGDTLVSGVSQFRFIDIPNNLYSGLVYQGIASLDIEISFYTMAVKEGKSTFEKRIDVNKKTVTENGATKQVSKAQLTFSSLNNFGSQSGTFSWNETDFGIDKASWNKSKWAESVSKLNGDATDKTPNLSEKSAMHNDGGKWYSSTHGYYFPKYPITGSTDNWVSDANNRWVDELGSLTFERGSLSYPITGTNYQFTLSSGTGNTWQSITSAANVVLDLPSPKKTVTRSDLTYVQATAGKRQSDATAAANNDTSQEKSTPYTPLNDGNGLDAGNDASTLDLNDDAHLTADADSKLNFDYWIFQPTYVIGVDSVAKPKMLKVTDVLPAGIEYVDVEVFNTDGTKLVDYANAANKGYTVTTSTVSGTGQTKVTINLTTGGLRKAEFNGGDLAFKIKVKTPAAPEKYLEFVNTADVWTSESASKTTNDVKNSIRPSAGLTIKKTDVTNTVITNPKGLEFTLIQVKAWNYKKNEPSAEAFTPVVKTTSTTIGSSTWEWRDLKPGQYELFEKTAPEGYQIEGDGKYLINIDKDKKITSVDGKLTFTTMPTTKCWPPVSTETMYLSSVKNESIEESYFPKTGSIGLVAFLLIGTGIIAFALVKRVRR
ncbi:hypothetical protein H9L19_04130 [Weissella diestrammenae]|uniref:SpaA-like prealbumin fold domain-containing protein n=1 Tax=Weissella diestrammenae TaxID=1162633 RepID=A0A7G9T3F9_9LACO|nr:SpaA isopeptide-forming pilin-related protein [Weissella diestrammenae]MCM0582091.1 hypothetical protein [Weissella diestrammenae]QNN74634.1 hypothetical protein H9L19_04130 [Weissella diestrammenae]